MLPLVFASCSKRASPVQASVHVGWGTDPIEVRDRGAVPRTVFQRELSRRFAGPWLRFLALDKAVRAELVDLGRPQPSRALLTEIRTWIRKDGLLREWQPAAVGAFRSGKAELDLTWCLGRIWMLRGGAGTSPSAPALAELFQAEVAAREPALTGTGARCGDHAAGPEEVYPDLLALLTPERRKALLLETLDRYVASRPK